MKTEKTQTNIYRYKKEHKTLDVPLYEGICTIRSVKEATEHISDKPTKWNGTLRRLF